MYLQYSHILASEMLSCAFNAHLCVLVVSNALLMFNAIYSIEECLELDCYIKVLNNFQHIAGELQRHDECICGCWTSSRS